MAFQAAVMASPPAWWSEPATQILDPAAPSENYAPLNLGQLKHVATQAKEHLDARLPGGAGSAITALVNGFADDPATNFSPINLGQLKAVAKPFYDRLIAAGYDTKANLIANGYPATWSHAYPWEPLTPKTTNYAPANLGQLKIVFSFNASGEWSQVPDAWKQQIVDADPNDAITSISQVLPGDDFDGDGATNLEEFDHQASPTRKDHRAVSLFLFHPGESH